MADKVPHIDRILETARRVGASDILLQAGSPPILRLDGACRSLDTPALISKEMGVFLDALRPRRHEIDVPGTNTRRFMCDAFSGLQMRVSAVQANGGTSIAIRILPKHPPAVNETVLPPIIESLCHQPRGILLVTGQQDSGRSTMLGSMTDYVVRNRSEHVFVIGAPPEFQHQQACGIVSHAAIGLDADSGAAAVGNARAAGANIISLDMPDDHEAIHAAIHAADAGLFVLATMNTRDPRDTIKSLIEGSDDRVPCVLPHILARNMVGIVSLALVPLKTGGRKQVFELLVASPPVVTAIQSKAYDRIVPAIQEGGQYGMRLMDDQLCELYSFGEIRGDTAVEYARHPTQMQEWIARFNEGRQAGGRDGTP